jgi:hypothetical protein
MNRPKGGGLLSSPLISENTQAVTWVSGERHIFAIGSLRSFKLYDCRQQGTVASLLNREAHRNTLDGIQFNPFHSHSVLSYSTNDIALWDLRRSSDAPPEDYAANLLSRINKDPDILQVKWSPFRSSQFTVLCSSHNQELHFHSTESPLPSTESPSTAGLPVVGTTESTYGPMFRRHCAAAVHSFDFCNSSSLSRTDGSSVERILTVCNASVIDSGGIVIDSLTVSALFPLFINLYHYTHFDLYIGLSFDLFFTGF